jgi:hypothetical protein
MEIFIASAGAVMIFTIVLIKYGPDPVVGFIKKIFRYIWPENKS